LADASLRSSAARVFAVTATTSLTSPGIGSKLGYTWLATTWDHLTGINCLLEAIRTYDFVMCEILWNRKGGKSMLFWIDRLQRINHLICSVLKVGMSNYGAALIWP
jgi:hypothetical protein